VNSTLSADLQTKLDSCIDEVDRRVQWQESVLRGLAASPEVQRFLASGSPDLPADLQVTIAAHVDEDLQSVELFDQTRRPLLLAGLNGPGKRPGVNFLQSGLEDNSALAGNVLLTKEVRQSLLGPVLQTMVPVGDERTSATKGFLVGELNLRSVITKLAGPLESGSNKATAARWIVIVLDSAKNILYHTDRSLQNKAVGTVMPSFGPIANEAMANNSGVRGFAGDAGQDYLVAFAPLPRLNLAMSIAADRSQMISSARRWGLAGLVLAVLAGLGGASLLERHVQKKSSSIERVAKDVSAIAKGELDRRIVLQSSDDARGLADNINVVTERLRAQIAREEESRQFESFVRLSAMLTHDLKNAIEALSLTVGNMERHFDNEQFRADALRSLTGATDKLKGIVARLTKPLTSLSGEHKRPTNADLVPMLKRVVAITAEPMREKHTIEIKLPTALFAVVDLSRIEEVAENLVLNALEAMSEKGGKLRIEAAETATGAAMFSVTDTGSGMSESFVKNRLFRPFSTTKKNGVGLGLYTCREVIQAHAGSIEVESIEGAGTTFRVVLPSDPNHRRN
jgi:signal transduction histidine kinase